MFVGLRGNLRDPLKEAYNEGKYRGVSLKPAHKYHNYAKG
jgi:hypothetical protein